MAAPSTGVTWVNSGLAVLLRDYAGSAIGLGPGGTFRSPFALDGQVRNDLLITSPVSVSATNCGFWLVRAKDPNGVSRKPKVTSDDLMIPRSNSPIRSDIQEESKTVVFRCFQNKPLLDRLPMNKPLSTVEDVGTNSYFQGKPASDPLVERQLILIRSDRAGGLEEPTGEPYPRAVLKDAGEAVMDRKNADVPVAPPRHRGIAGRARAGSGVMTNHPTSSSGFEEAARAGAAPPPPGSGTGHLLPTARPRLKQHGGTPRCSPSEGSALKTLRYRSASTNSRSRSPSSTPTTTNCAANSLQSASSGTHSARRR
jgi:hypothetical protein